MAIPEAGQQASGHRVAVVTGGSRGIGRAIALALAEDGVDCVVGYWSRPREANLTASRIRRLGRRAITVQADVGTRSGWLDIDAAVGELGGDLDIVVNNASRVDVLRDWRAVTDEEWDAVLAANLRSIFLSAQVLVDRLSRSPAGRIVNISSVAALLGRRDMPHYVAAKAGVIGLTRALARELGPHRITVNCVAPGAIRTEAELQMFIDQATILKRSWERQAIRRRGRPSDVASAVRYLASVEASFITGQLMVVDGGWVMR